MTVPVSEPRRRRWVRRAAWIAGGVLALAALLVVVVPPLLPEAFVGRIVARRMAAALGRDVSVAGASFSFMTGLGAHGIVIRERPGFGEGDFARIAELRVLPGAGRILISDGAEVSLVRNAQGLMNTEDFAERPPSRLRVGALAACNVRVRYTDLASGGAASLTLTTVEIGQARWGKRPVRLGARIATGGAAMAIGHVWLVPGTEEFDRAKLDIVVHSLALGPLAASLRPGQPVPSILAPLTLDGNLAIEALVERALRGKATVTLRGLPELPQLGLTGPQRALTATLSGELSALKPHFDLSLVAEPGEAARLTASLKQIVADGSVPSFLMDNYRLDVEASARADFSKGGLPGTRLAAGEASAEFSLRGTMAEAKVALGARLAGGEARLDDGSRAPLPPASLDLAGTFSLRDLCAQVSQLAFETEGVRVSGSAEARPAQGAKVEIGPDGSLPPMTGAASLGVKMDFAGWSEGLRVLAGLPRDRPASGTVEAAARAVLGSGPLCDLHVVVDRVPLDQEIPAVSRLPILSILSAVAGGKPEAMDFAASLDADFAARGASPAALGASLTGRGRLALDRFRIAGAPLLRLLAHWSRRPELRDVVFERLDAPFTLADGRVEARATAPYGGGALVFQGQSAAGAGLQYVLRVNNPRAVSFIPKEVVPYLEAGLPLMYITGPLDAPVARIPVEALLDFRLKHGP